MMLSPMTVNTPNSAIGQRWLRKRRGIAAALPQPSAATPPYSREGYVGRQEQVMDEDFNYDPSAAVNRYAQGAWGSISEALGEQLRTLGGRAVGQGRLDSGFYDADQGDIMRAGMRDFGNTMAMTAMDAERMRLGRRDAATDLMMSRREELENAAREQAERKRKKKKGIAGAIGGVLGAAGGFLTGGPAGIVGGWNIGSRVGGAFG